jgi:tetratricopeptide (TPR) repeat protein
MGKSILFLSFLLSISNELMAERTQSEKSKEMADSLITLATAEIAKVKLDAGLELSIEALALSREARYSKGTATSCFYIGLILNYMGNFDKSLEYLTLAQQEKYTTGDFVLMSEIGRIKGQIYFYLGIKNAAFREFQNSCMYAERIPDREERLRYSCIAYQNMAIAYKEIKNNADSILYWLRKNEKTQAKTEEWKTFKNKVNLYMLYGEHFAHQHQSDSATHYFQKALSVAEKYNYPYTSAIYLQWGDLHVSENTPDSALICYRKGVESLRITGIKSELCDIYLRISDVYTKKEIPDSARLYREKYLQLNAELSESKNKATEQALQLLLDEEQKYAHKKQRRIIASISFFSLTAVVAAVLFWQLGIRRKQQILETKEGEVTELKQKLNDSFDEIVELARANDTTFLPRFREVYPEFTKNLLTKHPNLNPSELQLCAMIFLNFSSKDIAQHTCVEHRSVQTRKSRLRKKLDISGEVDMYRYLKSFG